MLLNLDNDRLNSLTKYPSISNLHVFGDKGSITEEKNVVFENDEPVHVYEKIDGTNIRYITTGNDFVIGSREELIYAKGDRVKPKDYNVDLVIDTLKGIVKTTTDQLYVIYAELFGGKYSAKSKVYHNGDTTKEGLRVFDVAGVVLNGVYDYPLEKIASLRENNVLSVWFNPDLPKDLSVPRLDVASGMVFNTIESTYEYLKEIAPKTQAALVPDSFANPPEGIVIRNKDRSKIAKVKYQNYERHFKKLSKLK